MVYGAIQRRFMVARHLVVFLYNLVSVCWQINIKQEEQGEEEGYLQRAINFPLTCSI
jgi:hypothetical protein